MTPFLLLLSVSLCAGAGTTESILGEVVSAPADGERRFVVKKDDGGQLAVAFADGTRFLRLRPGATTLAETTPIGTGDLLPGDRVLCRGTPGAEATPWTASLVVVMRRADLDEQHAREREDWRRRGVSGVVVALDPATREITARLAGSRTQVVVVSDPRTLFRRYAPGSLRFADALSSSFAELAVADQVRVLGDRTADPTRILAEQVVSGAFRVVRGMLSDVDASRSTVSVRETARYEGDARGRGGLVIVALGHDTLLRRLPPALVMRLRRTAEGVPRVEGSPRAEGGAADDPAGRLRAPDPDELLERLPPILVQDLRKGDELAALGPRGPETESLTAIKLVVWTVEAWPEARTRARRNGSEEPTDPFVDVLGLGGENPW
jgi:hypothetical protein